MPMLVILYILHIAPRTNTKTNSKPHISILPWSTSNLIAILHDLRIWDSQILLNDHDQLSCQSSCKLRAEMNRWKQDIPEIMWDHYKRIHEAIAVVENISYFALSSGSSSKSWIRWLNVLRIRYSQYQYTIHNQYQYLWVTNTNTDRQYQWPYNTMYQYLFR